MPDDSAAAKLRREKNQAAARQSRQKRVAYILQLELSLRNATERIHVLEQELCSLRVGSMESCMLSQALLDPEHMGIFQD
jgi:hypothetical protein